MATIKQRIDTVTDNVTDGKTNIASAITDKGVDTISSATFSLMAENISKIISKQPFNVTGMVAASDNTPLSGVVVTESGTTNSATTDNTGHYTINDVNPNGTLIFSKTNYFDGIKNINSVSTVNIALLQEEKETCQLINFGSGVTFVRSSTSDVGSGQDMYKFQVTPYKDKPISAGRININTVPVDFRTLTLVTFSDSMENLGIIYKDTSMLDHTLDDFGVDFDATSYNEDSIILTGKPHVVLVPNKEYRFTVLYHVVFYKDDSSFDMYYSMDYTIQIPVGQVTLDIDYAGSLHRFATLTCKDTLYDEILYWLQVNHNYPDAMEIDYTKQALIYDDEFDIGGGSTAYVLGAVARKNGVNVSQKNYIDVHPS